MLCQNLGIGTLTYFVGGSITVQLTFSLTGLDSTKQVVGVSFILLLVCKAFEFKQVKQKFSCTVILSPKK